MVVVDTRAEIREFLTTRRAKISPEQAGLPSSGRRRVPGLRREEVAVLAGVSTDWYVRLERGHIADVSEDVLHAVARALRLDDAERAHLFDLARAAKPSRVPRRRAKTHIRPSVQWMLDAMTGAAAFVRNGRMDILAINSLGRALYSPMFDDPCRPVNIARFHFLDPRALDFYPTWAQAADTTVAIMRTEAGRDPHNRDLTDLVGELAMRSDEFRTRWAGHNVRLHHTGPKQFHHPVVGALDLVFEAVDLPTEDLWGLDLTVYTAEPGSVSEDGLKMLTSWAATTTQPDGGVPTDQPSQVGRQPSA